MDDIVSAGWKPGGSVFYRVGILNPVFMKFDIVFQKHLKTYSLIKSSNLFY